MQVLSQLLALRAIETARDKQGKHFFKKRKTDNQKHLCVVLRAMCEFVCVYTDLAFCAFLELTLKQICLL